MEVEFIKKAVQHGGLVVIKHIKSNETYYIKEIVKAKILGEWVDSVIYFSITGKFVRLIEDFSGFEYIANEVGLK